MLSKDRRRNVDSLLFAFSLLLTEEDYEKVFGKPPPKKKKDKVYEVGDSGVDISS